MGTGKEGGMREKVLAILKEVEESGEVPEATLFLNKILKSYGKYLAMEKRENMFRIYIYSIAYKEAKKKPQRKSAGGFTVKVLERGIKEVKQWDEEEEDSEDGVCNLYSMKKGVE